MANRNQPQNVFRDVIQAVRRHRRKSIVLVSVTLAATIAVAMLSSKEYRSVGKLFVRLGRENATLDATATLGQNPVVAMPFSRENEINSVVEILQSRALLEEVVDALGPDAILKTGKPDDESADASSDEVPKNWIYRVGAQFGQFCAKCKGFVGQFGSSAGLDDRQQAILQLVRRIKVEAAKKSNVVEITCEGSTPRQCQAIVAKLIDVYQDEHARFNRMHGSHAFFVEQARCLRDELTRQESKLRDLKNSTGLASPSEQRKMLVVRMGRLEDDLLHAETTQAVAEARVHDLQTKLSSLPETQITTETTGVANEGTDRMREQFYALQVREKEAQAKYTEDHPKMQQIRDQVATSRAVLGAEERNRKLVAREPGRLHQQAQMALLSEEPALASLQTNVAKLRTQLADVHKEIAALNDNEIRVAAVQREVDLLEADYRKYSNSLEQSRIDQQLEAQRMSNIGIVQPASFEPKPIRPKRAMTLLMGVGLAVFGGVALPFGLEQFGGTSPTPEQPKRPTSPVVSRVPHVSTGYCIVRRKRVPR